MPDSPVTFTAAVVQALERHRAQLADAEERAARVVELARRTLSAGAPHDGARRLAESILHTYDSDSCRPKRAYVVRDARPEDGDTVIELLGYIEGFEDLGDEGARMVRESFGRCPCPHHADAAALVAVDDADRPIGVLLGGAPVWMLDGPDNTPPHWLGLTRRIAHISAVAVDPEHRRAGAGRALIERAEHHFRTSGRRLVTLLHAPDLAPYYDALGYSVQSHFVAFLGQALYREDFHDIRMAFKPLDPRVRQTPVMGLPAPMISGILEDNAPPAGHWWFDGERLHH
ncbi:GNAT family N-acetyltransferase [Embleya scabrispora]|uniref:GNAT family N-acetyltransferase n=1 Tax=Embleya scabrispora TaxID=159449 RepID=UPI00137500AD|nr:GNAT family N-acetyltransferase [Embleya scabrispora]